MNTLPEHALECDRPTHKLIRAIMQRLRDNHPTIMLDTFSLWMDLTVCHNLGHVDLQALHDARSFDFIHDLSGIVRHLNRQTGELANCFLPRCSPESEVSR